MGSIFALQGAGDLGTGSFMDNNPIWIYIGGLLAVLGVVLMVASSWPSSSAEMAPPTAAQSGQKQP